MNYLSVAETAKKWNVSERSVRNYCAQERIPGAVLIGKTWHIPENAEKPARSNGKKAPVKTLLTKDKKNTPAASATESLTGILKDNPDFDKAKLEDLRERYGPIDG